ncbi:MAG: nucleotidyltransferase domain-containing protein [archaeon]
MNQIDFLNAQALQLIESIIERKYYLRELAECQRIAPSSIHKIMTKLASKKMVLVERQKNKKLFNLNYASPLTRNTLKLIFVNKIISSKAFKKLQKLKPLGIYLFGTAATGRITNNSDLDLAVFFEVKPNDTELNKIKRELENEVKREIQLIVLTKNKVEAMKKQKNQLLEEIKHKSIVLEGEEIESG